MVTIRTADRNDLAAVDALLAESYPRLLKADYAPSTLVLALPRISRAQPQLLTSGTYYLAEQAGHIVGAGGWTPSAPGSGRPERGVGHIRHVATDYRATRQGIASALMEHIFEQTSRQGLRRLLCLSTRSAVPFYEAKGFTVLREVNVPLGTGIDFPAVEMTRDL